MKLIRGTILLCLLAVAGCERKAEAPAAATPTPEPAATPAPPPAAAEAATAAQTVGIDDATPLNVETPETVDLDPQAVENQLIKKEVLKRIDAMPNLEPEMKDRLYVQVDRARAMGKVITIPFASGSTRVSAAHAAELGAKLQLGQVKELSDDPTVVFVVLGFADKKGEPAQNIEISLKRAESALALLRDQFRLMNVMHAVGLGSSEMFDAGDLDKNRVVEVWAVLP